MKENPHLEHYPLAEKQRERLRTPSGLSFQEITLEAALQGKIKMSDLRVTAEALEIQAQLAENAGRPQLAANLRRAAELAGIPEDRIMAIYNALRPGRGRRRDTGRRRIRPCCRPHWPVGWGRDVARSFARSGPACGWRRGGPNGGM